MKKLSVLFSLLVLTALVLSACAGGNNTGNNGTGLETPGVADDLGGTPGLGTDLDVTPTLEVLDEGTPDVMGTPTVAADGGAGVGTPVVETPLAGAEVPVTGDVCVPNRLANMMDFEVRDNAGNVIGEVEGVVVMRDASVAAKSDGAMDDSGTMPAGTPAAAPTAAAGDAAAAPTTVPDGDDLMNDKPMIDPASLAQPHVSYVIVDVDDAGETFGETLGNKDVLVPFTAFTALTPETAVEDCAFVMAGDANVLAEAPAFDDDQWDELYDEDNFAEWHGFWANQGVTIPNTGANGAELGAPVIFEDNFDDIDVENANGDDLGEIEDFVLDPQTGQFTHAILATGGFLGLGEKYIPVPVANLAWGEMDDDADDLGEMVIDVPEDQWESSPSFGSLEEIDTTVDGWEADIDAFWTNLTTDGADSVTPEATVQP